MTDIIISHSVKNPILSERYIKKIISTVFIQEEVTGSVSVHIVGEMRMKRLNAMYRGINRPTDVLSFGNDEQWSHEEVDLGDIFLCQPYIIDQAKRFGVSTKEEATRMLVHGLLHLLGYDHEKESDATEMFGKQEQYISLLHL